MKKCVLVGTGHRGTQAYLVPFAKELTDCTKLVAICDKNPKRAAAAREYAGLGDVPIYTDFDKMLAEQKPDVAVVTTVDATHNEFIVRALQAGCDVVTEKPMTTTGEKCNAIMEAEKRTGKHVTVTFNCRFMPFFVRVKEILREGTIGDIYSVHYEWMLDTHHGADYFRRWHRIRANSGSLLIHKSTHHFDLLNWWLEDEPEKVNAFGTRRFYTPDHQPHGERCSTCPYKGKCEYSIEENDFYQKIYYDCEDVDGYLRDSCIFSDKIDIEDTVAVNIRYARGAVVSYSLTAHSPFEGMRIIFNGSKGRMEVTNFSTGIYQDHPIKNIRVFNRMEEEITYTVKQNTALTKSMLGAGQLTKDNLGGHGGADPLMRAAVFRGYENDVLGQMADTRAGAMSLGIGAAANISMKEGRSVALSELFDFLKEEQ